MTPEFKEAVKALSAARRKELRAYEAVTDATQRLQDAEREHCEAEKTTKIAATAVKVAACKALGVPILLRDVVIQNRGVVIYWGDCITTTWRAHLKRAGQEVT